MSNISRPRFLPGALIYAIILTLLVPSGSLATSDARPLAQGLGNPTQPAGGSSNVLAAAESSLASGAGPAMGGAWSCQPSASGATCGSHGSSPMSSSGDPSGRWSSPVGPQARSFASMAYDTADHYVVLFGGIDDSNDVLNDTWTFNGVVWRQLFVSVAPPLRFGAVLAYDTHDGYAVLFGGDAGNDFSGYSIPMSDTWTFHGGVWKFVHPSPHPSARWGSAFTYDGHDGYLVLFGGFSSTLASQSDTWRYLAGSWTNITQSKAPPARGYAAMAYDSKDSYVVLFGGDVDPYGIDGGGFTADTWTFQAGGWAQLTPTTAPEARGMSQMQYDAHDGYVLLFGGEGCSSIGNDYSCNDTWTFVHGQWAELSPIVVPMFRFAEFLAYDSGTSSIVMGDGCDYENLGCPLGDVLGSNAGPSVHDQWSFSGGSWVKYRLPVQPGYNYSASMSYDSHDRYVLFFAGPGQTWTFASEVWKHLSTSSSPPVNIYMSMSDDPKDGYVLLFGGNTATYSFGGFNLGPTFSSESWKFVGGKWSELHPATVPTGRVGASLTYDASDGYVVMFGGGNATMSFSGTWTFKGGEWTGVTTSPHPTARANAAMAYDASDHYVVLFGGCSSPDLDGYVFLCPNVLGDTWTYHAGHWTHLSPTSSPHARTEAMAAYDGPGVTGGSSLGGVILFGGDAPLCSPSTTICGDTWLFLHGAWSRWSIEYPPPARFGAAGAFDPSDGKMLMQGGESGLTFGLAGFQFNLNDTWEFAP